MFSYLRRALYQKVPEKTVPRAQDFLEFEDIQNGRLILPGGKYRLVLEGSAQ